MPNTFFTGDWHLFHDNITDYCSRKLYNPWTHRKPSTPGTKRVKRMHEVLLSNHNELVADDDTVWNLGDVTMLSSSHLLRVKREIEKFNGQKHLILGNHDEWKATSYIKAGFWTVHSIMWFEYESIKFYLSHDPAVYCMIEHEPKSVLLCGHIHNLFKSLLPLKRVINVGVDVWGLKPASMEQIIEMLEQYKIL